jgi:preprotein translocase subunit SecD
VGKRYLLIFGLTFLSVSLLGLAFGAQVLADLTSLYHNSGVALDAELVLSPRSGSQTESQEGIEGIPLTLAQQVVDQRLDSLRLAGAYQVMPQGDQLLVKLPQTENMPYISLILSSVGEIEFIDGGVESPPLGQFIAGHGVSAYQTLFTAQDIRSVAPPDSATGQIFYQLELEPSASERLLRFTETAQNSYICMVLDGQVLNCSAMYHLSGNTLEILPGLSSDTVISLADLAIFLESGPLPVPFLVKIQ